MFGFVPCMCLYMLCFQFAYLEKSSMCMLVCTSCKCVSLDISFLDVSSLISSEWWFLHLVSYFHLVFLFQLVSVLDSLKHAYLLYVISFACFLSLTRYIGETPPSLKLDEMCMKFNFISICTYLCGVCPMCCWFSNSLVPMSLGTILFVMLF